MYCRIVQRDHGGNYKLKTTLLLLLRINGSIASGRLARLGLQELYLQLNDVWGDAEEDKVCLRALQQHEATARKKKPKYTEFKAKEILEMFSNVRWPEQGFWILHFEVKHCETAWTNLKEKYLAKQLPGVIRLSLANEALNGCQAIFCFVGPATDEAHCLCTGQGLIGVINYQPHFNHPPFVYYKLRNVSQYLYRLSLE